MTMKRTDNLQDAVRNVKEAWHLLVDKSLLGRFKYWLMFVMDRCCKGGDDE